MPLNEKAAIDADYETAEEAGAKSDKKGPFEPEGGASGRWNYYVF
jgi:hypothetical protein